MKVLHPKQCSTFGASGTQWWNALDFLQNVSRKKIIFCEKHFVRSLKAFHHCVYT